MAPQQLTQASGWVDLNQPISGTGKLRPVSWPTGCVNEVLLEHSHASCVCIGYDSIHGTMATLSSCNGNCMACKA